jgi:hypothetical protein
MYATQPGMINTPVVLALMRQEAEFIKSNPGRIIAGYNEKKIKFDRNQEIRRQHLKEISELTPEEKEAYEASRKYPRVVALLSK